MTKAYRFVHVTVDALATLSKVTTRVMHCKTLVDSLCVDMQAASHTPCSESALESESTRVHGLRPSTRSPCWILLLS